MSVWFIEVFTIFLPIWQVRKQQSLQDQTLETIAQWELKTQNTQSEIDFDISSPGVATTPDSFSKGSSCEAAPLDDLLRTSGDSSSEKLYTMAALNSVLMTNPEPLRLFSALRDFSGENIAFLSAVMSWVALWPSHLAHNSSSEHGEKTLTDQLSQRALFKRAIGIYAKFVSQAHADVPINIPGIDRERLDQLFGIPARVLYGEGENEDFEITPFEIVSSATTKRVSIKLEMKLDEMIAERVEWWGKVPDDFDSRVFNDAVKSIKYLVLTNTWPKFVKERLDAQSREDRPIKQRTWWRYFS